MKTADRVTPDAFPIPGALPTTQANPARPTTTSSGLAELGTCGFSFLIFIFRFLCVIQIDFGLGRRKNAKT